MPTSCPYCGGQLYSLEEAAETVGLTPAAIYKKKEPIPGVIKIGKKQVFTQESVDFLRSMPKPGRRWAKKKKE